MTSSATKLKKQRQISGAHLPVWARYVLSTIVGAILGLFAAHWFAELLPGPHVEVILQVLRPQTGNGVGCIFYTFSLSSDKAVDYLYLKLQVPNEIRGYRVGYVQEGHSPTAGQLGIQAFEMGRGSGGECDIVQAAVNNTIDIQSSAAGNMIEAHVSKLSPHSTIIGALATPSYGSSVKPPEKYFEGSYEYTILGQQVLRVLQYQDLGVTDAK